MKDIKFYLRRIRRVLNYRSIKSYFLNKDSICKISDLKASFSGSKVFGFATGGSVANLENVERLKNKNLLITTTGIVQAYLKYGFVPNMWFVHNPDSVLMTIQLIKDNNLETKIDFSNTFIFVPSDFAYSKDIFFSSKTFTEFKELISHKAKFVLYDEVFTQVLPQEASKDYLKEGIEPITAIQGSSVEASFLPILRYLGVNTLYFCGVDHIDTGHFWNRNHKYQTIDGKPLDLMKITPPKILEECIVLVKSLMKRDNFEVFRLEKEETVLKSYPYIEFEKAIHESSGRINVKDIK